MKGVYFTFETEAKKYLWNNLPERSILSSAIIYCYYLCGIGKCAAQKLDKYKKEGGSYEKIERLFRYDFYGCCLFCDKPAFREISERFNG